MNIYMFNTLCLVILLITAVIYIFIPSSWLNTVMYILIGAVISSLICVFLEDKNV